MKKPSVLVTFDSMKRNNCGYFSFGKSLGNALIDQNHSRFNLTYYLFKKSVYQFEGRVPVKYLSLLDNIYFSGRNNFDLLHLSDQRCRLKPSKVKAKRIMTVHDMNKVHLKYSKPHRIEAYLRRLGGYISKCDKVVAISQFVANDVLHYFPEAKDKVSVIYNGADKLVVPENHKPAVIPDKPFLYTIGRLNVQKGFHLLPALLANNDYHLVIAGIETPHKQKIIEEAEKYNCLDRVHITGPVSDDDKAWYYKNCLALVFPSIAEGFGLPVIEAMHFGKPVFLSRYTSLPEVGGEQAYYFDSFEPEHMQQVLEHGLADFVKRDRSAEMVARANEFTWDKAAQQYLKLYEECLAGK